MAPKRQPEVEVELPHNPIAQTIKAIGPKGTVVLGYRTISTILLIWTWHYGQMIWSRIESIPEVQAQIHQMTNRLDRIETEMPAKMQQVTNRLDRIEKILTAKGMLSAQVIHQAPVSQ